MISQKLQAKIDFLAKLADRENGDLSINVHCVLDGMQADVNQLKEWEKHVIVVNCAQEVRSPRGQV